MKPITNKDPEIKVTKINKRWHARLYFDDKVVDEMACNCSEDIGFICKEMLRMFQKMGGNSQYADKARHRKSTVRSPASKIYSRINLNNS